MKQKHMAYAAFSDPVPNPTAADFHRLSKIDGEVLHRPKGEMGFRAMEEHVGTLSLKLRCSSADLRRIDASRPRGIIQTARRIAKEEMGLGTIDQDLRKPDAGVRSLFKLHSVSD